MLDKENEVSDQEFARFRKMRSMVIVPSEEPGGLIKVISATEPWVPTGMVISAGHHLHIRVLSGSWSANPAFGFYDGNGWVGKAAQDGYAFPGGTEGALVGCIGGFVFQVGDESFLHCLTSGELLLSINDDISGKHGAGFSDNRGALTVSIIDLEPIVAEGFRGDEIWAAEHPSG